MCDAGTLSTLGASRHWFSQCVPAPCWGICTGLRAPKLSLALVNFPVAELSLDPGFQSDNGPSIHQVLSPRAEGVEPNLSTLVEPVHKAGTLSAGRASGGCVQPRAG